MSVCSDRCRDEKQHRFYASGGNFRWCWPKFNRYTPADKRTCFVWNHYPHNTIGAAVVLFGRCYGVRWKCS